MASLAPSPLGATARPWKPAPSDRSEAQTHRTGARPPPTPPEPAGLTRRTPTGASLKVPRPPCPVLTPRPSQPATSNACPSPTTHLAIPQLTPTPALNPPPDPPRADQCKHARARTPSGIADQPRPPLSPPTHTTKPPPRAGAARPHASSHRPYHPCALPPPKPSRN
ncbi:hypothetical protein HNY73_021507 [Argiope bruennichi]|uniref:Uncharacterized protein n=1 Tax=Argiope bruennichi TaxID=94029 RepID=A0A8T0E041_ARGBR|nr:hypothetical protein HNY73_021507 [Argiope bruennichi]